MASQSKKTQADKRRLKLEELRKQQQARERRRFLLIVAGAAVVLAVIAVVIVTLLSNSVLAPSATAEIIPAAVTGTVTRETAPEQVPNPTSITGVLAWKTTGWPGDGSAHAGALDHDHVPGPVKYTELPPVGGPHNATWMNAGVYTRPVPTERAVHNLEHGAVWITYNPNLPASQVAELTAFVTKQSMIPESSQPTGIADQANRYIDLSPWASSVLPSPIVISSWGYQLRVTSPSDPRLQQFVDTFRNSATYSPEYGSPVDGVPVGTGGRPALDGSRKPNPAG